MSFGEYDRKSVIKLENFDGGLNTKAAPTQLELNQSPEAQNVKFTDFGAVGTINGYSKLNSNAIKTAPIDGLFNYVNNSSTQQLLAQCASNTHYWDGASTFTTIASSESLFTQGVDVEFEQFQNKVYIQNGNSRPYKWDGTAYTRMGVSAPTATLSVATNSAGTLTGSYQYVYTGVNTAQVESDYGGASATFTAASEDIAISGIPTAPVSHGVNEWFLYRNTAAAEGVYYRVTAITNGTTAYTDNASDSEISTAAPDDNMPPRLCKYMVSFQGRLFMAGETANPSYLWYSESNTPEQFATTNFIRVGDGDGQIITGLSIQSNSICIHKADKAGHSSIYLLFTSDSTGVSSTDNWYLIRSDSRWRGESHKALTHYQDLLAFLNRDGVFAFYGKNTIISPLQSDTNTIGVDSISAAIEPDVQAFRKSLLANSAAITYNNRVWFSIPSVSTSSENDKLYVFDFVTSKKTERLSGAWIPVTAPSVNNFAIFEDELYGGASDSTGFVYKLDDTNNFDGSAINSTFLTAPFSGEKKHENWIKVWRYVYLIVESVGDWTMNMDYIVDFAIDGAKTAQVDVSADDVGTAYWDSAIWDTDVWGSSGVFRKRVRVDLEESVGQYIQLKFYTNNVSQYWKVHRVEVFYKLRGARD
jgi:hypothetical protein